MNKEKKKQYIAIFMLVMFFGSTFAIAMSYVFPSEVEQKMIFDEPLIESDEAIFLRQNIVVVRVYYDEPTDTIYTLNDMVNIMNQKIMLERININQYPELYDYMKTWFSGDLPWILLRGSTETYLVGEQGEEELKTEICKLYFEDIEECY